MQPAHFLERIIDPGLMLLMELGGPEPTMNARRMLLAIAMQESGPHLAARYQNHPSHSPGPARGFWQFEQGGGVAGVLSHRASAEWALAACQRFEVHPFPAAVWRTLEGHDALAVAFARLLLWTDPAGLPGEFEEVPAWEYYLRLWRPGKPHPAVWPRNWASAVATIRAHGAHGDRA